MLRIVCYLLFALFLTACNADLPDVATSANEQVTTESLPADAVSERLIPPDLLFGELFRRVQMEQVFQDGKTFVDCIPRMSAADIMENYRRAGSKIDTNLKTFVLEHFDLPFDPNATFQADPDRSIVEHIKALWPVLTRSAGAGEGDAGSLITLPKDYVVPGGRFREIYYWDSYFTMLGLQASGEHQRIRDMVDNFAYLIDEVGFIPNGNRTYYLTRSQPPFFAAMVSLLVDIDGPTVYVKYLDQLRKEYDWWMQGQNELTARNPAVLHVVRLADGAVLNRYYDRGDRPRAESYREDVETIRASGRDSATVARHLRSGAESGWDYSSRWLADGQNLSSIITTDIIPPDLNALLYHTEYTLEQAYRNTQNPDMATEMQQKRQARKAAMQTHLWNPETGWYEDYNFRKKRATGRLSLAGMYPFFFSLADEAEASAAFPVLETKFLAPGGVRSTLVETGQQWDAPNGWPPLQYLTVIGLEKYRHNELAQEIRTRWLDNNERVYDNVTKMVEKYNVEDLSLLAGGGEYPVQDGFGWSNGVYLALLKK